MFNLFLIALGFFAGIVVSALYPEKLAKLVEYVKARLDD